MNPKLKITFLTTNKSGVLSKIGIGCSKLGLSYKSNQAERIDHDTTRMIVSFEGSIITSDEEFIEEMESYSDIYKVEEILEETNVDFISNPSNNSESSEELITPENIKKAEEQLTDILGPISSIVVKTASEKTKFVNEFYMLLSEELEPEDRQHFINSVSDNTDL